MVGETAVQAGLVSAGVGLRFAKRLTQARKRRALSLAELLAAACPAFDGGCGFLP